MRAALQEGFGDVLWSVERSPPIAVVTWRPACAWHCFARTVLACTLGHGEVAVVSRREGVYREPVGLLRRELGFRVLGPKPRQ